MSIVSNLPGFVKKNYQNEVVEILGTESIVKDGVLAPVFVGVVVILGHGRTVLQTDKAGEKKRIEGQVAWETEKGLLLVRPFYNLLTEYEQSGKPFDQFLPTLLERLPEYHR